jgi:DNA-binding CsgD family transcriptional regulator
MDDLSKAEVLRLYASGLTAAKVAERFGVVRETISHIVAHAGISRGRKCRADAGLVAAILDANARGYPNQEIARDLDIDPSHVSRTLNAHGVYQRNKRRGPSAAWSVAAEPTLSIEQRAILLGTILGDGCLKKPLASGKAQLKLGHGAKQREYLDWKFSRLRCLFSPTASVYEHHSRLKYRGAERTYETCEVSSRALMQLGDLRLRMYPRGAKDVTDEVLEEIRKGDLPLTMAVWYMDDGSTHAKYARLVLGGYSE